MANSQARFFFIGNNMTISREQGLKTSIPPGSVRVQDEYGGGYMGMLEVFHQLHCLVRIDGGFDIFQRPN